MSYSRSNNRQNSFGAKPSGGKRSSRSRNSARPRSGKLNSKGNRSNAKLNSDKRKSRENSGKRNDKGNVNNEKRRNGTRNGRGNNSSALMPHTRKRLARMSPCRWERFIRVILRSAHRHIILRSSQDQRRQRLIQVIHRSYRQRTILRSLQAPLFRCTPFRIHPPEETHQSSRDRRRDDR